MSVEEIVVLGVVPPLGVDFVLAVVTGHHRRTHELVRTADAETTVVVDLFHIFAHDRQRHHAALAAADEVHRLVLAADPGAQVMAPAGGTVADVGQDDMMGTTVTILHADGVMSTCANLAAVPNVEIGDTVRTGDIIGSVGRTALGESAEASHLHLSMTKDGVSVDPVSFLPLR